MLIGSVILFAVAALGGVVLAFAKKRSIVLSVVHGLLAAAGLVTLILGVLDSEEVALPATSLALFVLAAIGGFALFAIDRRGRELSRKLIFGHGAIAVIAEVLLIIAIL